MTDYTFNFTVASVDSSNKYFVDNTQQAELTLQHGYTYVFNQNSTTNQGHPIRFSTTSDGTHNSGSAYTTGGTYYYGGNSTDYATYSSNIGNMGSYTLGFEVRLSVTSSTAATLYYYCGAHSGMGGKLNTTANSYFDTPQYGFRVPVVGGAENVWATHLNQGLRELDLKAFMHPTSITRDTTIESDMSAVMHGPISVSSGVTLTIDGSMKII